MDDTLDIAKLIKKMPKGTKLWSTDFGECEFISISDDLINVKYLDNQNITKFYYYDLCGRDKKKNYPDSKCHLFLEKGKSWYDLVKPDFDFKPFDKVLVRNFINGVWQPNLFGVFSKFSENPYFCVYGFWKYCIPFNEETEKLMGTKKEYKYE